MGASLKRVLNWIWAIIKKVKAGFTKVRPCLAESPVIVQRTDCQKYNQYLFINSNYLLKKESCHRFPNFFLKIMKKYIFSCFHWSYQNLLFWAGIVWHRLSANHFVRYFKLKKLKNYMRYQVDFCFHWSYKKYAILGYATKYSWPIILQNFLLLTCLTC